MRKLFLTSFDFTTDYRRVNETRLVIVTKQDKEDNYFNDCETDRDIAGKKALDWWVSQYTESELHSLMTHDAIDEAPKFNGSSYIQRREKKTLSGALNTIYENFNEENQDSELYKKFLDVAYILDPLNDRWSKFK